MKSGLLESAPWQLARQTALPAGAVSRRMFFFEEALPAGTRNIHRVYAPVQKLGVVLDGRDADGNATAASFCGTVLRLDDGRYRMCYTGYPPGHRRMWIAVAESADGLAWEKTGLGQYRVRGADTNRIVFGGFDESQDVVGQPQVLRLPNGQWRMYFWHHDGGRLRYLAAHSADGLRWNLERPPPVVFMHHGLGGRGSYSDGWDPGSTGAEAAELWRLKAIRTNDACYVYWNEQAGRFEYYAQWFVPAIPERRVPEDNMPDSLRVIQRRLSADGLRWSPPELVIRPDERDPWDMQFYHLAVQWHEDWLIGSLGHYRVEAGQQTQDLELAFSRDGRQWHRPLRGGFIPRSVDTGDAMGIYPPNAWIDEGKTWLCLYTGTRWRHNEALRLDAKPDPIRAARWPKNRLVGLAAGRVPGGFLTPPFFPQAETITLDAHIRGELRAELCDIFGRRHEGYHLMDSVSVIGDGPALALRWKDRTAAAFRHDAVRLRFEFSEGEIYSVSF